MSSTRRASKTHEATRRTSFDSDGGSSNGDMQSVISESFQQTMKSTSNDAHHIAGYLLKKSTNGVWQKRYFETNSTFLTYYKSRKMSKLLAALNMATVGEIAMVGNVHDSIGDGVVFQLELKDRNYVLRTSTMDEAEKWMYRLRQLRDEARAASIPEETGMDDSARGPEQTKDDKSRPTGEWSKAGVEISSKRKERGEKEGCCAIC